LNWGLFCLLKNQYNLCKFLINKINGKYRINDEKFINIILTLFLIYIMLFINLLKSNLNNQGANFLKISNPKKKIQNIKKNVNFSREDRFRVLNKKNLYKLLFLALSPFFFI